MTRQIDPRDLQKQKQNQKENNAENQNKKSAEGDFGSYIKSLRLQKKIPLRKAADLSGISNPYISQLERNKRIPTIKILIKLAIAYGTPSKLVVEQARQSIQESMFKK